MAIESPELSQSVIVQAVTRQTATEGASGDNEVIAAPAAGIRIVIKFLSIQNATAVATVAIIKEGSTAKVTMLNQNQGDGMIFDLETGFEWRLPTATALQVNLDGANDHYVNLWYWTETG